MEEHPKVYLFCDGSKKKPHLRRYIVTVSGSLSSPGELKFAHMVSYPIYNRETKELDQTTSGGGRPVDEWGRDEFRCTASVGYEKCRINIQIKRTSEARVKFNAAMEGLLKASTTRRVPIKVTLLDIASKI